MYDSPMINSLPLEFVGELLVSLNFPDSFGRIIRLGMVLPLVVNEHSYELIIHYLHINLELD